MKKYFSVLLCIIMILSCSMVSSANYRNPVNGVKMKAGLNPVVMHIDENHVQYAVYAVDMENMTNADMIINYGENMSVEEFEPTEVYSMRFANDTGSQVKFSFVYEQECGKASAKLFVITFEYSGKFEAPTLEIPILAGTFIKKVHEPVTVEYDGKNDLSEKITSGDVDLSGKITAADARLALRFSAKLEKLSELQQKNAEVNKDGKVTSADARLILRVSAGLEKGFENE